MESYFLLILKRKLRKVQCLDYEDHSLVAYKMTNSSDIYVFASPDENTEKQCEKQRTIVH